MNHNDGLIRAEGYCDLGMWQQAFDTLEDMPTEAKVTVSVLLLHAKILVGLGSWTKPCFWYQVSPTRCREVMMLKLLYVTS